MMHPLREGLFRGIFRYIFILYPCIFVSACVYKKSLHFKESAYVADTEHYTRIKEMLTYVQIVIFVFLKYWKI